MKTANDSGSLTRAIAAGATTPVPPEGVGATCWSSSLGCEMTWDGTAWRPNPLNDGNEPLFYRASYYINDKGSFAAAATTIGTAACFPFVVSRTVTITAAQVSVSAAGTAATVRGAIYNSDAGNLPNALVSELGTASVTSTGFVTMTPAANIVLTPGVYWIAIVQQGTTAATLAVKNNIPEYNLPSSTPSVSAVLGYSTAGVTAAYPTTWPPGTGLIATATMPRCWLKML